MEPGERPLEESRTVELVAKLAGDIRELVSKELELARAELGENVRSEAKAAAGLGIGGIALLAAFGLGLAALVLALAMRMPAWSAALIVAAAMAAIGTVAGLVGWAKRVRTPVERTQRTLKEGARWVKQRTK